jgi:sorbitol-specific phosphotransferase system component IIA
VKNCIGKTANDRLRELGHKTSSPVRRKAGAEKRADEHIKIERRAYEDAGGSQ